MWAVGDGSRFGERTGWQPRRSWHEGVRAMVQQTMMASRAA
jgi:nucleoside-diphosphate-sugar epimerase